MTARTHRWLGGVCLMISLLGMTACNDKADDPEPGDENELITTVNLRFTEQGSGTVQTVSYRDPDGEGGQKPVRFDTIRLKANTTYTLAVQLLDESKNPATDITEEVKDEQEEHLFVYTITPATLGTYTYGDKDARNVNVGLTGAVKTAAAGAGTMRVQLRHQPPVNGVPAKNGTPTPGSDDVNLEFALRVN